MIIFNDDDHTAIDNGINIPRVSNVLAEAGLTDFSGIPLSVMRAACDFGLNVHSACSLWDKDDLNVNTLDPALLPYLDAYRAFKEDFHVNIIQDELPVYSKKWGFCGKLDKYAEVMQQMGIVDLKSGSNVYPATAIQTALYEIGGKEEHNLDVKFRMCCQLKGDGTYSITKYTNKQDTQIGIAAVQLYHWKAKHKLLKGE